MSSIVINTLSSTVGLLVNKARDSAAAKLSSGDATDAKIRELLVSELNDVKNKLDALLRKDLLSSYSFLKQGIDLLNVSLNKSMEKDVDESTDEQAASTTPSTVQSEILDEALALSQAMEKLNIVSDGQFEYAKKLFGDARRSATYAFSNQDLNIEDRLMAAKLRIVATILESLESPEHAITSCLLFLRELHGLREIAEIFSVYLKGGLKSLLNTAQREEYVKSVMLINYTLFQFMFKFSREYISTITWPTIELGEREFNPILHWQEVSTKKSMGDELPVAVPSVEKRSDNDTIKIIPKTDVLKRTSLAKKVITTAGGEIRIDDITLKVGAGYLPKDTEITLIKDDQNFAFKSLHDLGLVDSTPPVVEFLPDGLEFLKPADLTIKVEKTDSELFILHGSYNPHYQKIVWKQVTNDIEDNKAEGVVKIKINGFSLYSYFMLGAGKIAQILSHLNNSFSCCAYVLYRRLPSMDTIDISVVFLSKFADDNNEEDIKQLKTHYDAGYIKGEKGVLKTIHTNSRLELNLEFPGVSTVPILVKVEEAELDDYGFVVDQFKGITVNKPAKGMVRISEEHPIARNELLWLLSVREIIPEQTEGERVIEQSTEQDAKPPVVYQSTKLTNSEISRVSRCLAVEWDSLAGLLDIPYSEREEIKINDRKYPDPYSKAEQILERFNGRQDFNRRILENYLEELGLEDVKKELYPVENEMEDKIEETATEPQVSSYENVLLVNTPFSPREMYRLSRRITVDWDNLAGLMDIEKEERNDMRQNTTMYKDHRQRAEKILSLYNRREDFSRSKLAEFLKGIGKDELINQIMKGQLRN